MLKITNKFNPMYTKNYSKGVYLPAMHNLELYIRTFVRVFKTLFEPKRRQVFSLKILYQKVLSDFHKKKSVITYDFHIM